MPRTQHTPPLTTSGLFCRKSKLLEFWLCWSCRDDRKATLLIAVRPRSGPRAVEAKILPRHCCSRNLIQNFFGYPSLVHLVETERLAQESSQTGQYSFHTVCSTVADERSRGICFCSRNRKRKNSGREKSGFKKKKEGKENVSSALGALEGPKVAHGDRGLF